MWYEWFYYYRVFSHACHELYRTFKHFNFIDKLIKILNSIVMLYSAL